MKRMLSVCLALMLLVAVVPAVSSAATYGYVTGGWLRMRSGPSFSYSTIASYYTGTMVEILGTSGSWYNVEAPDGKTGYMYSSYITFSSGGTGTAYVTSSNGYGVRMRSGPSTGYSILGVYAVGTAVTILETGTNWDKIQIGSTVGFMMNQFLTTSGGGSSGVTATIWSSNGYGVRLRSGPGTSYSIIGVYSVGTTVTVLSKGTTWDNIRVGSRTGYMMNSYLNYSGGGVATGITISPTTTSVAQGASVTLTTTVSGSSLSSPAYTLAITQNASMATLSGDSLTVNGSSTATVGSVIIVTATSVDKNSSGSQITASCSITVTAGTPLATAITITPSSASVKQGNGVTFTVSVSGTNLSSPAYTLAITQNPSMASLSGNTLTVNSAATATVGSVIKVTAVSVDNNSSGYKVAAVGEITVAASTAPGAPTLSAASAGNTQVTLAWAAPSDTGGSAITGYVVYHGTSSDITLATSTSLLGGSLTGTTVTGLTNGTPYYFWVAAVNAIGTGSASASLTATPSAAITYPAAPTLNSATAGNAQVTLAWTAPTDTGSSALTGFMVYHSTSSTFPGAGGNAVLGGSTTGYTVTGLTNGTTYYFWVTAVNGTGEGAESGSKTAVPSAPPTDIALSPSGVAENTVSGSTVGTLTATDTDTGDTFTFALVAGTGDTDNASFTISGSSLKLAVTPDYETKSSYSIRVQATDSYGNTFAKALTVSVANVNEAPSITSGSTANFNENGTGTAYDATATDPESDTLTWSLGGTDSALFSINSGTGAVSFLAAPNYESPSDSGANNVYDITVTATDGGSLSDTKSVAITVVNVNEAPVIDSGSTATGTVGSTSVTYSAHAVDPESATITWSLDGTGDAALFSIDGSTGALAFLAAPSATGTYTITLVATDPGSLTDTQTVTVTVT